MIKEMSAPALERGLRLIECLAESNDGLSFTELKNRLNIPKPSLVRFIHVLWKNNYINKTDRKYKLGYKMLSLSSELLGKIDLRTKAYPYLKQLMEQTNETIELEIFDGKSLIVIEKIESEESVRLFSQVGDRFEHLHASAPGKIVLAYTGLLTEYIKNTKLLKITEKTIINLNVLEQQLAGIRNKGYAFDDQEIRMGIRRISAPVFDLHGKLAAVIDIAGPVFRIYLKDVDKLGKLLNNIGLRISRELGYKETL